MSSVLRFEFTLAGHDFRMFWLPEKKEWLAVNSTGQFSFKGKENLGLGRLKAHMKKLMVSQYEYLLDNASRVIAVIDGVEGYLDTFRFSDRKKWAKAAVLA